MLNKVHTISAPEVVRNEEKSGQEGQGQGQVRDGRRSAIMNLMDFVRRHQIKRQHHHRKIVDLTESVNAAEMAVIEKRARGDTDTDKSGGSGNERTCEGVLDAFCWCWEQGTRIPLPLLAWTIWLAVGTVFYSCHDDLGWSLGFFQSLNIGWSVGWVLPIDDRYEPKPASVAFSLAHTVVGVLFSGLAVLFIAKELESGDRGWAFQGPAANMGALSTPQGGRGEEWQNCTNGFLTRCWSLLHSAQHIKKIYVVFVGWFLVGCGWHWISFPGDGVLFSADYAISTLAGAGYRGVPAASSDQRFQFVLSALYAAVALPLMRITEGLLIGVLLLESKNKNLSEKIVQDISESEIEAMNAFCTPLKEGQDLEEGREGGVADHLQLAEFTLLIALRVGAVSLDTVGKIQQRFRTLDRRHEQRIRYEDVACSQDKLRQAEERKHELVNTSYSIRSFLTIRKRLTKIRSKNDASFRTVHPDVSSPGNSPDKQTVITSGGQGQVSSSLIVSDSLVHDMWTPSATSSSSFSSSTIDRKNTSMATFGGKHESAVTFKNRMSLVRDHTAILELDEESSSKVLLLGDNKHEESPPLKEENDERKDQSRLCDNQSSAAATLSQPYKGRLTNLFTFEKTRVESFADYDHDDDCSSLSSPGDKNNNYIKNSGNNNARRESGVENRSPISKPSLMPGVSQRFSKARHLHLGGTESGALSLPSHSETREVNTPHGGGIGDAGVFKNIVKVKLSSLHALKTGLKDAKELRKQRLARPSSLMFLTKSHAILRRAHKKHVRRQSMAIHKKSNLATASFYFFDFLLNPQCQALLLWVMWLLSGTLFFWMKDGISFIKAFYQSVNTGYGVFMTKPVMNASGHAYMLLHIIVGTMIVSGSLTLLATHLNYIKQKRQIKALTISKTDTLSSEGESGGGGADNSNQQGGDTLSLSKKIKIFILDHQLHLYLLCMVVACSLWSSLILDWSLLDGLYFTISLLSTGGQVSMPETSPDWHFLVISAIAAVGVPLMALSFGLVTHSLSHLREGGHFEASIGREISPVELDLLRSNGLEDGNGYMEICEFAVLMLLRIGALHPDFLKLARYRFQYLAEPGATLLSIHKIGGRSESKSIGDREIQNS